VHPPGADLGSVKTARLDDLVEGSVIDFLKIDTEGTEMRVLRGAVNTIKRNRPIIMLELLAASNRARRAM
jgi:FkbM family methyltransferase